MADRLRVAGGVDSVRVVTWSLDRKRRSSPVGMAGVGFLRSQDADVMVLTDARRSYPGKDGYLACSQRSGDDDERKVVMWSRQPWTDIDNHGSVDFPKSRFVAASTSTPQGQVRVVGVCMSQHTANVTYGSRDREPWDEHIQFCNALAETLQNQDSSLPIVLAGDFKQRIPSGWPNHAEVAALANALDPLTVVTAGTIEGTEVATVEHIAVWGLVARRVWGWPNVIDGVRCSGHGGVAADLTTLGL